MTCLLATIATLTAHVCQPAPPPPITDWPALVTVYDTALCAPGMACLQGNGDGRFASMIPVSSEWYGRMAACPAQLFGRSVRVEAIGLTLFCGDSFGSLDGRPVETAVCHYPAAGAPECYVRIDIFWPVAASGLPDWNYALVRPVWLN